MSPKRPPKPKSPCEVCTYAELPGFLAFELGFAAGAKAVALGEIREFVDALCDPHAASLAKVLAKRLG